MRMLFSNKTASRASWPWFRCSSKERKVHSHSFSMGRQASIEYRKSIGPLLILRAIDFMRNVNCESPDDVFNEKTGRHFCDLWRGFFGSQQSLVTFYASRF
jgi:hypothetical protein